jgi:ABC-2 type transport system permease protein
MREIRLAGFQTWLEQRSFWRNPEYVVFTFTLPMALLLVIGATKTWRPIQGTHTSSVALFVGSILAFSVVVAAYGNLAARMAIARSEGVLKRIRTTPLRPVTYLAAQLASTLVVTLMAGATTIILGLAVYGAAPRPGGEPLLILGLVVGITCFASLGLALSTVIRSSDVAGPISNATYLPIAIVSGVFDPSMKLPGWLSRVVGLFPVKPLTNVLEDAYNPTAHHFPAGDLGILAIWTVAGVLIAVRWFRWQPVTS